MLHPGRSLFLIPASTSQAKLADLYHLHGRTGGQEWKGEAGFTLASTGFSLYWMVTVCFHTVKGLLWRKQNKASSLLGSGSLTMGLWRVLWPPVR